jgi:hypothetical protein
MTRRSGRRPGVGVLVAGWAVVLAGAIVVAVAVAAQSRGRDEMAGGGLALVMVGLMVVLAGNYMHHRSGMDTGDPDTREGADRPGGGPAG